MRQCPAFRKGSQYLGRTHRYATGSRDFRIYLPARQPKRPKGLIATLQACRQNPDDFALGTHMNLLAETHGIAVAYSSRPAGQNAASCWNWFNAGIQTRGAEEPAILASLARKLKKDFGLDRESVFVAGLSTGGAMAAILVDVYPDVFYAAGTLLHKSSDGWTAPIPGQTYPMTFVTGMPSAVYPFSTATRTWNSTT